MYAIDEDDIENVEEATYNEEDQQAWCLSEETAHEQWQELISRRDKQKVKKPRQASPLRVENRQNSSSKKFSEVKDRWVKVRVTTASAAAGNVMLPRVKLEYKTSSKIFVAATVEHIRDMGEKISPVKRGNSKMHNIQKCECCHTSHFNAESCPSRKHCCAGRKESAHSECSRNNDNQDEREQRSVHNGHVDLPR